MDEDALIEAVRDRAADPATRTDYADRGCPELAPPVPLRAIDAAEQLLGISLWPLHKRLLTDVGNGGFGPGDGLLGLPGGRVDDDGRSVVDLRTLLGELPEPVLPLVDWGDAIWSCLDEECGRVLTLQEGRLVSTKWTLATWLEEWVSGGDIWGQMFVLEERSGINPFTKKAMTFRVIGRPIGDPYVPRSHDAPKPRAGRS